MQIFFEKFISQDELAMLEGPDLDLRIHFEGEEYHYLGKDFLLDFLEENGRQIPFACRSGVCGACKLKKLSGKVNSLTEDGLNPEEKKDDYILSCVSKPLEDSRFEL